MSEGNPQPGAFSFRASGMTLVEVVVSTAILAVMFVAGLSAAGAAASIQGRTSQHEIGVSLATELMEEILEAPFADPDGSALIARESGELATVRSTWDDVDDYDGWSASPPQSKDGANQMTSTAWTRSVSVVHVDPADLATTSVSVTGVKRITVRVLLNGTEVARLVSIRTDAWPAEGSS